MELWIRSQDKRHLIKAEYVSIMENNIINVASSGWDYDVAKYKSKERAMEILDEIQQKIRTLLYLKPNTLLRLEDLEVAKAYFERINKQEFVTCDSNFEIIPFSSNVIVYEMPKE